jgi:virginiamycin B lyase
MSQRQQFPQLHLTGDEAIDARPARPVVTHAHRRPAPQVKQQRCWFLLGMIVLLCMISLVALMQASSIGSRQTPVRQRQFAPIPAPAAAGTFREYPFPRPDNEVMRPAIDHQGRLWFGAMGQNALVVFDPRTRTFQYLTPPHGHHGIMGVLVAPDDTIWFAEQAANYLGHYDPATRHYQLYPLPWLTVPDPGQPKQIQLLPSAPNELALDGHGDIWFTEFNADRLGRLDPRTGHIRHYALSAQASVQTLYPYGVTIDRQGMVWFSEAGTNQLGRLDPSTGAHRVFTTPDPHTLLMEVTSDAQGAIWVTSFTPGLLLRFRPGSGTFTSYLAPVDGRESSAFYGLLVTPLGDVWVTNLAQNVLARLDVAAQRFLSYHIPKPGSQPLGLAMDGSHALWFTGVNAVGVLHP